MPAFKPPGQCPVCGEWVPRGQVACDDCGACAKSGWKADAEVYDGLDLPGDADDDFNYDEFIEKEFGAGTGSKRKERSTLSGLWWWVAVILIASMVYGYILMAR